MFGFGEVNKEKNAIKEHVVTDMADFLMGYGFKPTEAERASRKFWTENAKKLNQVYTG